METLSLDKNKRYSYADYLTWMDDKRRELFNGVVRLMSPAPTLSHQQVSVILLTRFFNFLETGKCKVFSAPFDVRLPKNGEKEDAKIYNVVQPDIVVVCDPKKLDEKGCIGAPDLIVEILSKSTGKRDLKDKFLLYEQSGVEEYWIADPIHHSIQVFLLNPKSKYELKRTFVEGDKVSPDKFPDLVININDVFEM